MHVLIAGCGWLGSAVAQRLVERGERVTGVRSEPGRAEALRALGVEPLVLDLADPASVSRIPQDVDAIIAMQSAQGEAETHYRRAYIEANRTLLEVARRQPLRAFIYTGSTGVFGQRDGSDVDELTPPAPANQTGQVLLEAEQLILNAAKEGVPARIVRLSGLYGPGRYWVVERMRRGFMTLGPGDDIWMNSCHQDDAALTILASLDQGRDGAIYHATDAVPMRRREVIAFLANRLGIAPSRVDVKSDSSGPNRRIWGDRTRTEFGLQPRWPSLREGLALALPVREFSQKVQP